MPIRIIKNHTEETPLYHPVFDSPDGFAHATEADRRRGLRELARVLTAHSDRSEPSPSIPEARLPQSSRVLVQAL